MAQHKQSMERTMQSSFKHKRAGTEMATAVVGIEAMIESGIDTAAVVENQDSKVVGRSRAALCHKAFGKRMADAVTTLDQIIADEGLTIVAEDKELRAQHKQGIRKVVYDEITRKIMGKTIADIADKAEQVVDELIVIYGTLAGPAGADGPKTNAVTEANLATIKTAMEA